MATNNSTATPSEDLANIRFFGMEEGRADVLIDASGEIEALADLAIKELGDEFEVRAIRALVKRIKMANGVIISAIGDQVETTEALRERLAA